jgi:hypothetical protein
MSHPLRWTALIAIERPELPPFERIASRYAAHYPDAPPLTAAGATENLLTFAIGEFTAAATLVPRPIPPGQLEGPAATAWYWPDAAESLSKHTAHILVTLIDEGGAPVEKAIALTRLTAAIAATAQAVGVFWGPGRLVHPPSAFIEQAETMTVRNLPLFLWVDFRIEREGESDAYRLFTTGLEALGGQELEAANFTGQPQQLLDFVYNIAHYQLDRRKLINDGDTIGVTDAVQATARRGPSMFGGDIEVIQLEFDG